MATAVPSASEFYSAGRASPFVLESIMQHLRSKNHFFSGGTAMGFASRQRGVWGHGGQLLVMRHFGPTYPSGPISCGLRFGTQSAGLIRLSMARRNMVCMANQVLGGKGFQYTSRIVQSIRISIVISCVTKAIYNLLDWIWFSKFQF